ncbi:MAG: hypothetical protein WC366_04110 [Bacilli bacterium]|jgi:hypothetical protein
MAKKRIYTKGQIVSKIIFALILCLSFVSISTALVIALNTDDYVVIHNQAEFENISRGMDKKYKLIGNLQFTRPIKMIGDQNTPFTGVFDGRGGMILGYTVSEDSLSEISGVYYSALFYQNDGIIKNLEINTASIDVSKTFSDVTISAFSIINRGTISHCNFVYSNAQISAKKTNYAAICYENNGVINNVHVKSDTIISSLSDLCLSYVTINNFGLIKTSYIEGSISASAVSSSTSNYFGGFACFDTEGLYINCFTACSFSYVSSPNASGVLGGIVAFSIDQTQICDSYVFNVFDVEYFSGNNLAIGGFIGKLNKSSIINNCLSRTVIGWKNPTPLLPFIDSAGEFLGISSDLLAISNSYYCGNVYNVRNCVVYGLVIEFQNVTIETMGWNSAFWSINGGGEIVLNYVTE